MTQNFDDLLENFRKLKRDHPKVPLARHLSTVVDDLTEMWGMSDKEFLKKIKEYRYNNESFPDEDIDEIIKGGFDLYG